MFFLDIELRRLRLQKIDAWHGQFGFCHREELPEFLCSQNRPVAYIQYIYIYRFIILLFIVIKNNDNLLLYVYHIYICVCYLYICHVLSEQITVIITINIIHSVPPNIELENRLFPKRKVVLLPHSWRCLLGGMVSCQEGLPIGQVGKGRFSVHGWIVDNQRLWHVMIGNDSWMYMIVAW